MNGIYEFSDAEMKAYASNIFIKILICVMKKDLTDVKHFLSDELYNKINNEIEELKSKNLTQVYEEPSILESTIVNNFSNEENYIITIKLKIKVIYYILNEKYKIIRGNDKVKIEKVYNLVFQLDKNYVECELTPKCPNCDASININMSGKCEHCGTIFPLEKYDWILKNIR